MQYRCCRATCQWCRHALVKELSHINLIGVCDHVRPFLIFPSSSMVACSIYCLKAYASATVMSCLYSEAMHWFASLSCHCPLCIFQEAKGEGGNENVLAHIVLVLLHDEARLMKSALPQSARLHYY
eukprot:gnl/TRDRNA2_/TRDRNA2_176094_c1_seq7.p1 gnl/TRDRNA2_/TRDRNA2_176094_c1~~gnl/TRDRNA2_/TRDRNA2_176094_c1_seq7.p1  ORF type:complete len:126 (+),score=1.52 gnl/TRDRNA2_/TRDRNA2_176094_c1_seq7:394-771(+)